MPKKKRESFTKDYIENNSEKVSESGCWIWLRKCDPCGYGKAFICKKAFGAHRASYLAFYGSINEGMHILHKCDTRCCVNPHHLYEGSHYQNMMDRGARGRTNRPIGEKHPREKISELQAFEIIRAQGNHSDIAKQYDLTRSTISKIKNGALWPHLKRN